MNTSEDLKQVLKLTQKNPIQLSEGDYLCAIDEMQGLCLHCRELTNYGVEGDAAGYTCECCDNSTVIGTEDSLLYGAIAIV